MKLETTKRIADAQAVAKSVYNHVQKWASVHERQAKVPSPAPVVRWSPPERGSLKLNFDRAISKLKDRCGGGVVHRDQEGAFRGGEYFVFPSDSDPEIAEIMACCKAVQMVVQMGAPKVHVEVDNKEVATILNDTMKNLSAAVPII